MTSVAAAAGLPPVTAEEEGEQHELKGKGEQNYEAPGPGPIASDLAPKIAISGSSFEFLRLCESSDFPFFQMLFSKAKGQGPRTSS